MFDNRSPQGLPPAGPASPKTVAAGVDLADLDAAIAALAGADAAGMSDVGLADGLKDISSRIDRLEAVRVGWVGEFTDRGLAKKDGATSTAAWLKDNCRLSGKAARDRTDVADALGLLPATAQGLADGTVSLEQARPIVDLAKELQPEQIAQVEKELARSAGVRDADEIRRRARRLAQADRQQAADKAMRMWRDRKLRTWTRGGMLHGEFELPPEGGAYLKTALEALTTYDSNTIPDSERRTKDQRSADALIELAKLATDHHQLPEWEGERPHVLVTVDLNTLTDPDNPDNRPAHIDHVGPVSADTALRICCDARCPKTHRSQFAALIPHPDPARIEDPSRRERPF